MKTIRRPIILQAATVTVGLFITAPLAPAQVGPGYALSLNGINQCIQFPSGTYFGGDFTIEAWVYTRNFNTDSRVLDFIRDNGRHNVALALSSGTTGRPALIVSGSGSPTTMTAPVALPPNQWVHLAATMSNTTGVIYLDGQVVASSSSMINPQPFRRDLNFVGRMSQSASGYANAILDEVRIWQGARSPAQIQATMHQRVNGTDPNLVAYWRFDEGGGNTAMDDTPNSNVGTLINNPLWLLSTVPFAPDAATAGATAPALFAFLNGIVNPGNLPTTAWFQWGTTTNYGNNTVVANLPATNVSLGIDATITDTASGPYSDLSGAASPHAITPVAGQKFYRVKVR